MDAKNCPCCGGSVRNGLGFLSVYPIKSKHWRRVREVVECHRCHAILTIYTLKRLKDKKGNMLFRVPDKGFCLVDPTGLVVEEVMKM